MQQLKALTFPHRVPPLLSSSQFTGHIVVMLFKCKHTHMVLHTPCYSSNWNERVITSQLLPKNMQVLYEINILIVELSWQISEGVLLTLGGITGLEITISLGDRCFYSSYCCINFFVFHRCSAIL